MELVDVLAGSVRVRLGDDVVLFTVLVLKSTAVSPVSLLKFISL
jgi:hypothetical protein